MGSSGAESAPRAAAVAAARRQQLLALAGAAAHALGDECGGAPVHGCDAVWAELRYRSPTPEPAFEHDAELSVHMAHNLPTFSLRKAVRAEPSEIARARFPVANEVDATEAPREPPAAQEPPPPGTRPLSEAPWWQSLQREVDKQMHDFMYGTQTQKSTVHRRRTRTDWVVKDVEHQPFTGGRIWDLTAAQNKAGVIDWTKVVMLDTAYSEPDSFRIGNTIHEPSDTPGIQEVAEQTGLADDALLYDMTYGCSVDAPVVRHAILSPPHAGALKYWEQISQQMQDEVERGWWYGPYRFCPIFPFRAVPRGVVCQPRPDGSLKYRITVDLGWPHDGTAPNAHIVLADQPPLVMARLTQLAAAADILYFTGEEVCGFGVDLEKAYRHWAKRRAELWQQVLLWYELQDGRLTPAWYIDRRTTFGDAIMVHKFTRIANMIVHFTRHHLQRQRRHAQPEEQHLREWREWRRSLYPDEPQQWQLFWNMMFLDDHSMVTAGYERAVQDREDVFYVTNKIVGCPAQPEKNDPVSRSSLTQLGGTLDFGARWLDRSDKFARKFAARLDDVLQRRAWSFEVCRSTAYMANHLAQFRPTDRPRCSVLFAEMRRLMRRGARGDAPISDAVAEELRYWRAHTDDAGGMPFYPATAMPARGHPRRVDVETDASGAVGFGAFIHPPGDDPSGAPLYFWGKWSERERHWHINVKELIVTYWLVSLIGELMPGKGAQVTMYVVEHIDNTTAMAVAAKNSSNASPIMNELAKLRTAALRRTGWTIAIAQKYINTKKNTRADALSRGDLNTFLQSVQKQGYRVPIEIQLDDALRDTSAFFA